MTISSLVKLSVVSSKSSVISQLSIGTHTISGSVKKLGISIGCRVRLFEKLSGKIIDDIKTDSNGNYMFKNLPKNTYFIVAHDPIKQYNAVIQDNVVPV